jgi:hypothetical protein
MLSFTKKKEDDPLLEYLLRFRQRIGQARQRLTDAEKTCRAQKLHHAAC